MSAYGRYLGLSAVVTFLGMVAGCGTDAPDVGSNEPVNVQVPGAPGSSNAGGPSVESPRERTGSGSVGGFQELARFRARYSKGQLSFERLDGPAPTSGIRPQGFGQYNNESFEFTTSPAMVVNNNPSSVCAANAQYFLDGNGDPYFQAPSHTFNGNDVCTSPTLCAMVNMRNLTGQALDRVFVQVESITQPNFKGNNPAPKPPGYEPLDPTLGLWSYGTLNAGDALTVRWDVHLDSCEDFDIYYKIMGLSRHAGYTCSGATALPSSAFVDACGVPANPANQVALTGGVSAALPMPFPFTVYNETFDAQDAVALRLTARGTIGLSQTTSSGMNQTTANWPIFTVLPFWEDIELTTDGLCARTDGTAPNRTYVATWNAKFVGAGGAPLKFSAILHESSDRVDFQYAEQQCDGATYPGAFADRTRGANASIGIKGAPGSATQCTVPWTTCVLSPGIRQMTLSPL